jgi:hypothetical protein
VLVDLIAELEGQFEEWEALRGGQQKVTKARRAQQTSPGLLPKALPSSQRFPNSCCGVVEEMSLLVTRRKGAVISRDRKLFLKYSLSSYKLNYFPVLGMLLSSNSNIFNRSSRLKLS